MSALDIRARAVVESQTSTDQRAFHREKQKAFEADAQVYRKVVRAIDKKEEAERELAAILGSAPDHILITLGVVSATTPLEAANVVEVEATDPEPEKRKPGRPAKIASAAETLKQVVSPPAPRAAETALDAKVFDIMQRAAASGGGQALFQVETLAGKMEVPALALDKSFTRLAEAGRIVRRACELKGHAAFEVLAQTEAAE